MFAQTGLLVLCELTANTGEDGLDRVIDCDVLDFFRGDRAVIEAYIVESTAETPSVGFFDADHHFGIRSNGARERVAEYVSLGWFAVDVQLHAGCLPTSVVSKREVL